MAATRSPSLSICVNTIGPTILPALLNTSPMAVAVPLHCGRLTLSRMLLSAGPGMLSSTPSTARSSAWRRKDTETERPSEREGEKKKLVEEREGGGERRGRKEGEKSVGETEKREEKEGNGAEKTRLEERVGGGEERESERGERGEGGEKRRIVEVEVEKGLVSERWRFGDEDSERERRRRERYR